MKKNYLLMAILIMVMSTAFTSCYVGRYGYREQPRYYGHDHHERFEHGHHYGRH